MRTIKKGVVCQGVYKKLNYVTGEKLEAIEQVEYCIVLETAYLKMSYAALERIFWQSSLLI